MQRATALAAEAITVLPFRDPRTVVVKTSAWPYADEAHDAYCRDLTYRTLPAVAASREGIHG